MTLEHRICISSKRSDFFLRFVKDNERFFRLLGCGGGGVGGENESCFNSKKK